MKVPHLMSIRPMECWLATLSASFCDNVTCFGTRKSCSNQSHLQECFNGSSLLAWKLRVQLSTCYPISLSRSFPHTPCSFPLCPAECFQDILFEQARNSHRHVGIPPTYQVTYLLRGRMKCMKVPHLMSIRPMECWLATLKASSATMSHALEQLKAARIRVICKSASIAPHFLLARVQLSIFFPISRSHVHLTASFYLCPAGCFQDILYEKARNSHWNMLAFLRHIKWHICSVGRMKCMKVPHLKSVRPMECWLATLNVYPLRQCYMLCK